MLFAAAVVAAAGEEVGKLDHSTPSPVEVAAVLEGPAEAVHEALEAASSEEAVKVACAESVAVTVLATWHWEEEVEAVALLWPSAGVAYR